MIASKIEGGCLCGGVRYRLLQAPERLCDCHCIDCRRSSGAAFVTWGSIKSANFELLAGELRPIAHADRLRFFAACCGTPISFRDTEDSEWIDVTICSLDDPAPFAPGKTIWTEDRLPWVANDPARPAFLQRGQGG